MHCEESCVFCYFRFYLYFQTLKYFALFISPFIFECTRTVCLFFPLGSRVCTTRRPSSTSPKAPWRDRGGPRGGLRPPAGGGGGGQLRRRHRRHPEGLLAVHDQRPGVPGNIVTHTKEYGLCLSPVSLAFPRAVGLAYVSLPLPSI